MKSYPTDIVMDSGAWWRIHQGHGLDRDTLWADFVDSHDPLPDEIPLFEEVHFVYQPRVKHCGNHGDACDNEGEWHAHWHEVRRNDRPETYFTIVGAKRPPSAAPSGGEGNG